MRTHANSKHKIPQGRMASFELACKQLSKRGLRFTTRKKILSVLGRQALWKKSLKVAIRILRGHMINLGGTHVDARPNNQGPLNQKKCKSNVSASSSGGRRETTKALMKAGFVNSFTDVELCKVSRLYMKDCLAARDMKVKDVQANANMIHRYVAYVKETHSREQDVILSGKKVDEFILNLSKCMKPSSIQNHAVAMLSLISFAHTGRHLNAVFPPNRRSRLHEMQQKWQKIKKTL